MNSPMMAPMGAPPSRQDAIPDLSERPGRSARQKRSDAGLPGRRQSFGDALTRASERAGKAARRDSVSKRNSVSSRNSVSRSESAPRRDSDDRGVVSEHASDETVPATSASDPSAQAAGNQDSKDSSGSEEKTSLLRAIALEPTQSGEALVDAVDTAEVGPVALDSGPATADLADPAIGASVSGTSLLSSNAQPEDGVISPSDVTSAADSAQANGLAQAGTGRIANGDPTVGIDHAKGPLAGNVAFSGPERNGSGAKLTEPGTAVNSESVEGESSGPEVGVKDAALSDSSLPSMVRSQSNGASIHPAQAIAVGNGDELGSLSDTEDGAIDGLSALQIDAAETKDGGQDTSEQAGSEQAMPKQTTSEHRATTGVSATADSSVPSLAGVSAGSVTTPNVEPGTPSLSAAEAADMALVQNEGTKGDAVWRQVQRAIGSIRNVGEGNHEFKIRLTPKALGSITIDIRSSEAGVAIGLVTETSAASDRLNEQRQQLMQELTKNGLGSSTVDISREGQDSGFATGSGMAGESSGHQGGSASTGPNDSEIMGSPLVRSDPSQTDPGRLDIAL